MNNPLLVEELNNCTALVFADGISMEELQAQLAGFVNGLIQKDFQRLVSILYRVDVSETRLKQLLRQQPGEDAGRIIANLLIERQLEKIKTRQQYRRSGEHPGAGETW
jgi:hypothetical protein